MKDEKIVDLNAYRRKKSRKPRRRLNDKVWKIGFLALLFGAIFVKTYWGALPGAFPSVQSRVEKLQKLGITDVSASTGENVEDMLREMRELSGDAAAIEPRELDGLLLTEPGLGEYDYDAWTWTPTSKQVYAFDLEVFDVGGMYTQFLQGVQSILGVEPQLTEIEEKVSPIDGEYELHTVSFLCGGTPYTFDVRVQYDWFNPEMIGHMNEVLEREGSEKRLWATGDGYQTCILFFQTEEWAKEFEKTMGYALSSET